MGDTDVLNALRLGVNIDHVATVRNARGGVHPDPVRAALEAIEGGADGITAHLREDRRHIRDDDIHALKEKITRPLNFEMAATEEMRRIALDVVPNACCLVPERREELTTEGGLSVAGREEELLGYVDGLKKAGIRISLFIDPDGDQVRASRDIGADIVELHTGRYCDLHAAGDMDGHAEEYQRIVSAAQLGREIGLEVHAGHGLGYATVGPIAAISDIVELNIGHFLMGEALFGGLRTTVATMRDLMDKARSGGKGPNARLGVQTQTEQHPS